MQDLQESAMDNEVVEWQKMPLNLEQFGSIIMASGMSA